MRAHLILAHLGAADAAADVVAGWTWEPGVVLPLAATALLWGWGLVVVRRRASRHGWQLRDWRVASFATGWLVLALALVSPLHEGGEHLFWLHMVQHELLMVVAAPLLVLGRPLVPMLWALPPVARRSAGSLVRRPWWRRAWTTLSSPWHAWLVHAAVIWVWHAPILFQSTLTSEGMHAAQHLSFFGSALLFWWALLERRSTGEGTAVLALFTTAIHTGALGALLTFSPTLWYPAYAVAGRGWGTTPLADQELAGLVMWIPATVSYMIAALALLAQGIARSERHAWRAAPAPRPALVVTRGGQS